MTLHPTLVLFFLGGWQIKFVHAFGFFVLRKPLLCGPNTTFFFDQTPQPPRGKNWGGPFFKSHPGGPPQAFLLSVLGGFLFGGSPPVRPFTKKKLKTTPEFPKHKTNYYTFFSLSAPTDTERLFSKCFQMLEHKTSGLPPSEDHTPTKNPPTNYPCLKPMFLLPPPTPTPPPCSPGPFNVSWVRDKPWGGSPKGNPTFFSSPLRLDPPQPQHQMGGPPPFTFLPQTFYLGVEELGGKGFGTPQRGGGSRGGTQTWGHLDKGVF